MATTYTLDDVRGMAAGAPQTFTLDQVQAMQGDSFKQRMLARETNDLSSGLRRGARDVIDTGAEGLAWVYDKLVGKDPATGEHARVQAMNKAAKDEWRQGTGGELLPFFQRFAGQLLAATPATAAVGAGVRAAGLPSLGNAIATGGATTGRTLPPTLDLLARATGGGVNGAMTAGMIDPDSAALGGAIGAALPPVLKGASAVGAAFGRGTGAAVPGGVPQAVQAARAAGYVIPPTQASPTLANRVLEGMAGKLSTAQNASAMNQPVTNQLAAKAIGAESLTAEGLAAVRAQANGAYDALARVGSFQADDAFRDALQRAGGASNALRKDFPELAHGEVDALVQGLSQRTKFDAQSTIEAIKRLRYDGSVNKGAMDPGKRALGSAQMRISNALEDLIDRNLKATGADDLLAGYRDARTTLARVYDVERALNVSTGNVDATKLAGALKKGRPLIGDLKTIADFAGTFPKAAQLVERMGSLPQLSPLDFGFAGVTGGVEGLFLRPAARSLALSPLVQNRLGQAASSSAPIPSGLLGRAVDYAPLIYRGAPLLPAQ